MIETDTDHILLFNYDILRPILLLSVIIRPAVLQTQFFYISDISSNINDRFLDDFALIHEIIYA